MPDIKTPSYIKSLLQPTTKRESGRKVWSIDLQYVWLPFFTATNVQGDTTMPKEAIGAPLRLAKDKDGSVKFKKDGRPVLKVAGELSDGIRMVRENFVAGLVNYAGQVMKQRPDDYKAESAACQAAGAPIIHKANEDITKAQLAAVEQTPQSPEKVAVGAAA